MHFNYVFTHCLKKVNKNVSFWLMMIWILFVYTICCGWPWTCNLQRTYRNILVTVDTCILFTTINTVTVILLTLWFVEMILMMTDYRLYAHWSCAIHLRLFGCICICRDDLSISITYRRTVYLYNLFLCSQLDPLICSLIPPDTSYI